MTPAEHLESLHVFAAHMLGSRDEALAAIALALDQHPHEPERWLAALAAPFLLKKRSPRVDRFGELDDILRTNSTIPVDLSHPLVRGDLGRLTVLLSELQRTCLLATLHGLTSGRRVVFILRHVLGLSVEACAAVCGATANAVAVADGRARRDLENYLSVRCEHLAANNPCHCAARLGNALDRGLIAWPNNATLATNPSPGFARRPFSNVRDLYASLPRMRLPVVS